MTAGSATVTNGEFSGSSSSSTQPVSYVAARSMDGGAYAAGGSGSVSSDSVPYNSTQTNNDAWNDRPAAAESSAASQYSSVVPASQRRPYSNDVQEYDNLPFDSLSFSFCFHCYSFVSICF